MVGRTVDSREDKNSCRNPGVNILLYTDIIVDRLGTYSMLEDHTEGLGMGEKVCVLRNRERRELNLPSSQWEIGVSPQAQVIKEKNENKH